MGLLEGQIAAQELYKHTQRRECSNWAVWKIKIYQAAEDELLKSYLQKK